MFHTVVGGAVAFPSTCSATDVTIYFLDWSYTSVPCFKFAAWVRTFPLFRGLLFFSRSTRYPANEGTLWLRECFWIDVERNGDRVQPPSISNRLPYSCGTLWRCCLQWRQGRTKRWRLWVTESVVFSINDVLLLHTAWPHCSCDDCHTYYVHHSKMTPLQANHEL